MNNCSLGSPKTILIINNLPYYLMHISLFGRLTTVAHPVEPEVQEGPDHDIEQEQERVVDVIDTKDIDATERAGHHHDQHHRTAGREAHRQELVVDMALIRREESLMMAPAVEDHPDHVERRHQQGREGHDQRPVLVGDHHRIVAGIADRHEGQQVTQRQAARVAHKDLAAPVHLPEHVVIEKGNQNPQRGETDHRVDPNAVRHIKATEHQQRRPAQSRGQAVDTVDQVDGVGNEDRQEDGQRNAHPCRDRPQPEQAIEVIDPDTR